MVFFIVVQITKIANVVLKIYEFHCYVSWLENAYSVPFGVVFFG